MRSTLPDILVVAGEPYLFLDQLRDLFDLAQLFKDNRIRHGLFCKGKVHYDRGYLVENIVTGDGREGIEFAVCKLDGSLEPLALQDLGFQHLICPHKLFGAFPDALLQVLACLRNDLFGNFSFGDVDCRTDDQVIFQE